MSEAEEYKIPGIIMKTDSQKNPVAKYGIDRMTLTNAGLPNEEVNHLYRGMYVYSVGFFNLVKEILNRTKKA